ncbi:2-oxoadipate dioxygenase/decarboxylase [Agromyces albus]|uniref:2-oxoadipate dioxygenase/decarboxylase n=1 Tax=Agromyces albus TaxID=205332 RepID=UPI002787AF65|nr:VOC family protein [Agromyces albus]MDQ0577080.1 putative glyoxalase superfamily metalloenzyme YdcJ [Agromyces albus]
MTATTELTLSDLRAAFALRLATLYGNEVPVYNTLVDVSKEVNEDFIRRNGADAERLGSIERVTAERHGAIRVGSARELAQVARVFAGFGMHPVGFYDLRDASASSVPVVSTAFRPIDADELARNPFRVFTSMLAHDDRRFFDEETQQQLETFLDARTLFGEELLGLADRSARDGGLEEPDASRFLDLATAAFELSQEPVDHDWYFKLERISAVAADIGGVPSTHINHLTPRVLDIDDLYERMEARGITMIDEIQGPPDWDGPDVLLRQTSFKALAEERRFRHADGEVRTGSLRVRFGEVEQRGIALTAKGRDLYDRLVAEVDSRRAAAPAGTTRVEVAEVVWSESLPATERELALQDLAFFTYRVADAAAPETQTESATLRELVESGALIPEPIVYEDFLPRSAAGIFQSNLTDDGSRDDEQEGTFYDIERLSEVIGIRISDPTDLYAAQQRASLTAAEAALDLRIITDA